MSYDQHHFTKSVDLPGVGRANVDLHMVDVITELNKAGLTTLQCCEGGPHVGYRYITFDLKDLAVIIRDDNGGDGTITLEWLWSSRKRRRWPMSAGPRAPCGGATFARGPWAATGR